MATTKIHSLEVENLKRVKAVALEPAPDGLTVIGGRNGQGKTSVLDAIMWALGGDRKKPSEPRRNGSMLPPRMEITLDNGLRVSRSGPSSALKVIDPGGNKSGQRLLDSFVHELAIDMPKFLSQTGRQKADTLLRIVGVGEKLAELEELEGRLYAERTAVGRERDAKAAHAMAMPDYVDAPEEELSIADLISRQQDILARNGENERKRRQAEELGLARDRIAAHAAALRTDIGQAEQHLARLRAALEEKESQLARAEADRAAAQKTAEQLQDESTAEIEASIAEYEETNAQVRANLERERADDEANERSERYKALSARIEQARADRRVLLDGAAMPLPGMSVDGGELTYNGYKWDNMAASEQLKAATAIVRRLQPQCGFVLVDKLEQMDTATLREFAEWAEAEGLQVIGTRVSTGGECSVLIEDGRVAAAADTDPAAAAAAAERPPSISTGWKNSGGGF